MREVRIAVAVLAVGVSLIAAPAANALITVGSPLSAPIDSGVGGDITAFPVAPASELTTSPVVGTVVGGHVKQDTSVTPGWGTVSLRVVHHVSGSQYQVLTAGPPNVIPTGVGTFPVAAHLQIAKGDIVAIQATMSVNRAFTSGATYQWAITADVPPGGPPDLFNGGFADSEVLYNAQIDPTNSFTVGAPTGGKKGRASLAVTVPNPGTVDAGAINDARVGTAAKKKKSKPLLIRVTVNPTSAGPVTLDLTASKAGRKVLREKGKLKTTVKVVYTPTGGSASSQTVKLKLKK